MESHHPIQTAPVHLSKELHLILPPLGTWKPIQCGGNSQIYCGGLFL